MQVVTGPIFLTQLFVVSLSSGKREQLIQTYISVGTLFTMQWGKQLLSSGRHHSGPWSMGVVSFRPHWVLPSQTRYSAPKTSILYTEHSEFMQLQYYMVCGTL